ncbi:MAG: cation:proton antiporter [Pseudomonadota bacterium]
MASSHAIDVAKHILAIVGSILDVGMFSGLLAKKLKIPDVAIFLLAGIALEPGILNFVDVKADSPLNQLILIFGACYILFDGGASLRLKVLKEISP